MKHVKPHSWPILDLFGLKTPNFFSKNGLCHFFKLDYTFASCKKSENAYAQFPRKTLDNRTNKPMDKPKKALCGSIKCQKHKPHI